MIEAKEWKFLLQDYACVSGQCINYNKSSVYFFNTRVDLQAKILSIMGCLSASLPGVYLGLPLTVREVSHNFWNSILERMQKKLAGWKGQLLSNVGKLQLLKASLQGILVYFLSLFRISGSMAEKLERIHRSFLWMGVEEKKRLALVNWDTVCHPNVKGGWGSGRLLI